MDEVIGALLLLVASVTALVAAVKSDLFKRVNAVLLVLGVAAGGLFVLVADAALKAFDAATK